MKEPDEAAVERAVEAYDLARRTMYGRQNEPPMAEANKASIAPMIRAAIVAAMNEPKL